MRRARPDRRAMALSGNDEGGNAGDRRVFSAKMPVAILERKIVLAVLLWAGREVRGVRRFGGKQ